MNPFIKLTNILKEAVDHNNADMLLQCLGGRHLPALGNDDLAADVVYQAMSFDGLDRELANSLAALTAGLVDNAATAIETGWAGGSEHDAVNIIGDGLQLFNIFLLASYLPANSKLFQSLKDYYLTESQFDILAGDFIRIRAQMRQAIVTQQIDDSFEHVWFDVLKRDPASKNGEDNEWKGLIYQAWKGLLWIHPEPEQRDAGIVVSMGRIDKGLKAMHEAALKVDDGKSILQYAVRILNNAYPRSETFWAKRFLEYIESYPQLLKEVLKGQWPLIDVMYIWQCIQSENEKAVTKDTRYGLAETLKSQGKQEELKKLYRDVDKDRFLGHMDENITLGTKSSRLEVLIHKRVKQLNKGLPKLIETNSEDPVLIAFEELFGGKISLQEPDDAFITESES